jgi:hypothetical protein
VTHPDADKYGTPKGTGKKHPIRENGLTPGTGRLQCPGNLPHPAGKILALSFSPC